MPPWADDLLQAIDLLRADDLLWGGSFPYRVDKAHLKAKLFGDHWLSWDGTAAPQCGISKIGTVPVTDTAPGTIGYQG